MTRRKYIISWLIAIFNIWLITNPFPIYATSISNPDDSRLLQLSFNDTIARIDLRISEFEKNGNRTELAKALTEKAGIYFRVARYDDALMTANQALLVANEEGREQLVEPIYHLLSLIHIENELVFEAAEYLYAGYQKSLDMKDTTNIGWYLVNLSEIEEYLGRVSNALEINLTAIDFFKNTRDTLSMAKIYRSQGVVHTELKNFLTAEDYFRKAYRTFYYSGDSLNLGLVLMNQASLNLKELNLYEAQRLIEQAMKLLEGQSQKFYLRSRCIYSELLVQRRNFTQAIEILQEILRIQLSINDQYGYTASLSVLGKAYLGSGNRHMAIDTYTRCAKIADKANLINFKRDSYRNLASILGAEGNSSKAYYYLSSYVTLTDSLFNLQKISEANRLENQAMLRMKEKEIAQQKEQIILNSSQLRQESVKQKFLYIIILLSFGVIVAVAYSYRQKKTANALLTEQNNRIEKQRDMLEFRAREIMDSLNYAQRIQRAILHSSLQPEDFFSDSFLIFIPKEVVSGDFYWFKAVDNLKLFAIADCTGHGAPGAFMSIIGMFGLNQIITEYGQTHPGDVLNQLNELFYHSFEQREGAEIFDGMDIGFCEYNTTTRELKFAGANIYLYILRKSSIPAPSSITLHKTADYTLYQVKCNRQSIGYMAEKIEFSTHSITLMADDTIYLFTDGFVDQFGGPQGKKFRYNELRALLCEMATMPMSEQKNRLLETFTEWKGGYVQVDDVTMLGVRID